MSLALMRGIQLLCIQQLAEVFDRRIRSLLRQEIARDVQLLLNREARLRVDEQISRVPKEPDGQQQKRNLPKLADSPLRSGRWGRKGDRKWSARRHGFHASFRTPRHPRPLHPLWRDPSRSESRPDELVQNAHRSDAL